MDKPVGFTSHDVVAKLRGILRTKKIGHTGTLDPFATGVLVMIVGKATKLAKYLDKDTKSYEAIVRFGFETAYQLEAAGYKKVILGCRSLEKGETARKLLIERGSKDVFETIAGIPHTDFLYGFYTILILSDILIVLLSQCYQPSFYAVFRNSGFALSTLIIRIALAAPPFFNVLLGLAASFFAILLTIISHKLFLNSTLREG